jgi:hypothetical protein
LKVLVFEKIFAFKKAIRMSSIQNLADDNILKLYESIRQQVSADLRSGSRHCFMGDLARRHEAQLREEIDRRRLRCTPIEWPRQAAEPEKESRG